MIINGLYGRNVRRLLCHFPQPLDYGLGLVTNAIEVILIVLLFLPSR